jgi:molybdenum cofactor cytidylyltransferase
MAADLEGILLAAGESSRMGYPKPLLKIGNETYLAHLARAMLAVVARVTIVVGAHADRIRSAIPSDSRLAIVDNPDYRRGQLSSIKAALRSLPPDTTAALIHLTDHPTVTTATFSAVVARYRESKSPIVVARYRGRRGHPVLFGRELFAELLEAAEDQGARVVVNADPAWVCYVDVDDPGILLDLDTPEDLDRAGLERPPKV